jgi:hypothetical protein
MESEDFEPSRLQSLVDALALDAYDRRGEHEPEALPYASESKITIGRGIRRAYDDEQAA